MSIKRKITVMIPSLSEGKHFTNFDGHFLVKHFLNKKKILNNTNSELSIYTFRTKKIDSIISTLFHTKRQVFLKNYL